MTVKPKFQRFLLLGFTIVTSAFLFAFGQPAFANNLTISNVSLEDRDASAETAIVEFDISWDNSWRNAENHDAAWVILKVTKSSTVYHGMMKGSGVNPADTSPGSNKNLEVYVPTDETGAFIRRKVTGTGTVTSTNVRLKLNYGYGSANPDLNASSTDELTVKVIGIEMVFVPTAAFRAGDGVSTSTFLSTTGTTTPWYIYSEATIRTNTGSYYYQTDTYASNDNATGSLFTIPVGFPKGYAAFYSMKYEVTEGLWVDFIDSLWTNAKTNRDLTGATGKNTDSVSRRNTVCQGTCTGDYGTSSVSSNRSDRALGYIDWKDLCAFLDWAALRPMTELEFEKAARGPLSPVTGEYAWGSTNITAAVTISTSPELGLETISTASANANYNSTTFSRGDDFLGSGANYTSGMLRVGIFATSSTAREAAGAGYYGVMELSGNAYESCVSTGNNTARNFSASATTGHGDGVLVQDSVGAAYAGNANVTNWPGTSSTPAQGVTGSVGYGWRGGGFDDAAGPLRISDRNVAASEYDARYMAFGGRGVRSYDGP